MPFSIIKILKRCEGLVLNRPVRFGIGFVVVLEIFSLLASIFPVTVLPIFVVLFVVMVVGAIYAPHIAVSFVIAELVYGAFGRMIAMDVVSLRMVLFLGFMVGCGLRYISNLEKLPTKISRQCVLLMAIIIMGVGLGLWRGNELMRIFADVNAFFFIPLLLLARPFLVRHVSHYLTVLFTMVFLFCIKTLIVFWYFAGGMPVVGNPVYVYLRDTRVFEITAITTEVSRVFSSAAFFVAIPFLYILLKRITFTSFVWGSLLSSVLLIGFSRSLLVSLLCAIVLVSFRAWRVFARGIVVGVGGCLFVGVLLLSASFRGNYFDLWYGRTRNFTNEVAAVSRYEQVGPLLHAFREKPLLGHGFGASLAISTPQSETDGVVLRSAFEWGYFDAMFKLGIFGLVLSYLVYQIFGVGNTRTARAITLTVLVTHIFTPLLFHPIGMGMLVFASLLNVKSVHEISGTDEVFSFDLEPLK